MALAALSSVITKFAPGANKTILGGVDLYLKKYAPQFGLTSAKRIAAFMAQASHETAGFKTLREYWGPTKLQIRYEGRKDLGNTQPGDGKRFLGRGIFQITGRANYATASKRLFNDNRLVNNPELLEQPEWAVLSALHYWNDRNLNNLADKGDFIALTKKINGGTNGLVDRQNKWITLTNLLGLSPLLSVTEVKKKLNTGFGSQLITDGYFFLTGKTK